MYVGRYKNTFLKLLLIFFSRPPPKKEVELTEAHVSRHLAFAFTEFLDRQLASSDAGAERAEEMRAAKENLKKAFELPEDDSLKVSGEWTRAAFLTFLVRCRVTRDRCYDFLKIFAKKFSKKIGVF
jgi:hypothetical protein